MNTRTSPQDAALIIKETFGEHPEDVICPAKIASNTCDWLEVIFYSIRKEMEGDGNKTIIRNLASLGEYVASDFGNLYDNQHEAMFEKLKEAGVVPMNQVRRKNRL